MTSVTLVPDDIGLQRLRSDNNKPATTQEVTGITHPRPLQKNRAPDEKIQPINTERRRSKERRRSQDRRNKHRSVLLDTRSHRERRRSRGSRLADQGQTLKSINVKI